MGRMGDGLYRRGGKGGTWWLDFTHKGTRHVLRIGKGISRSVAAEIASVQRARILRGEAGIGRKRLDVSFDEAAQRFTAWMHAEKRASTVRGYTQCLAHLAAAFGGKRLSQLTPWLLEQYRKARTDAGAPIRVNRELAVLKTLFNKALAWKLYEGDNPVRAVRFRKEPRTRLRILEPEEEARLLAAAADPLRTLLLVGLHTGLRRSELFALRWADVDLERGQVTVQAAYAKNGRTRTVPLNRVVRDALARLRASATGDHVFPGRRGALRSSIRTAFARACQRAQVHGVTLHTLRHTFASRLVLAGVDLRTVQELGGWQTIGMVQRYSHLTASHKAQAVEKLTEFHNAFHNTTCVAMSHDTISH